MKVPSYFNDFLSNIRLTQSQINDLKTGHATLRKRLNEDEELSQIVVSTFLQGSYKRNTAVKPCGDAKADVDIIVVTNLDRDEYTPDQALHIFDDFLDKYYYGKYRIQGRSIGISLSYVDLDIVITSAPSESEKENLNIMETLSQYTLGDMLEIMEKKQIVAYNVLESINSIQQWKMEPLWIPDRDAKQWVRTHPIMQIQKTLEKNKACNTHYINVVKAIKWLKRKKMISIKHPKSYPLEHLIWNSCPDYIESIADGVTLALEYIVNNYARKPFLSDHGVPEHDVFKRITEEEYAEFYSEVEKAAIIARKAYDEENLTESVTQWRKLFGNEFPASPEEKNRNGGNGFTSRTNKSESIPPGRFA